jgi:hypothetical protein
MKIAIVGSRTYSDLKAVRDFVLSLPGGNYRVNFGFTSLPIHASRLTKIEAVEA